MGTSNCNATRTRGSHTGLGHPSLEYPDSAIQPAAMSLADDVVGIAAELRDAVDALNFAAPVTHVYNPLSYAWAMHEQYLRRFAASPKRVVLLGMNPGPWGMAQTGVPFGEIPAVRDWMQLDAPVTKPGNEHPKRPVEGLACERSEVSGRRLWGLFAERWPNADDFFADHFVANYCPLSFMESAGRNRTPDKLPRYELEPLYRACDRHLEQLLKLLDPDWAVGVGAFARTRIEGVTSGKRPKVGQVLHPSPASPAANRGWSAAAEKQLKKQGIWE